jgi:hypothetical protein
MLTHNSFRLRNLFIFLFRFIFLFGFPNLFIFMRGFRIFKIFIEFWFYSLFFKTIWYFTIFIGDPLILGLVNFSQWCSIPILIELINFIYQRFSIFFIFLIWEMITIVFDTKIRMIIMMMLIGIKHSILDLYFDIGIIYKFFFIFLMMIITLIIML